MEPLRLLLFSGLVIHKLVWEVMKRTAGGRQTEEPPITMARRAVKLCKALVLVFLCIQTLFLNLLPIADDPRLLRIVGTLIYTVGLATALLGRLQLGRNWANLEDYRVLPQQALVTRGIYRYIRHPIYVGDILLVAGLQLALNSWLVAAIVILVPIVIRQAVAEEAKLSDMFPTYRAYCAHTRRFIPFVS